MTALAVIARVFHVLVLAFWMAGATLITVLSPHLFERLASRHEALEVLALISAEFDLWAQVAGPVALVTLLIGWAPLGARLGIRAALCLSMTGLVALNARYLAPKMEELRAAMGRPIEDLLQTDPLRADFVRLEFASEIVTIAHLVFAFLLLVSAIYTATPRRRSGRSIEL